MDSMSIICDGILAFEDFDTKYTETYTKTTYNREMSSLSIENPILEYQSKFWVP